MHALRARGASHLRLEQVEEAGPLLLQAIEHRRRLCIHGLLRDAQHKAQQVAVRAEVGHRTGTARRRSERAPRAGALICLCREWPAWGVLQLLTGCLVSS
jgi:hypothetical protein